MDDSPTASGPAQGSTCTVAAAATHSSIATAIPLVSPINAAGLTFHLKTASADGCSFPCTSINVTALSGVLISVPTMAGFLAALLAAHLAERGQGQG